MHSTDNPPLFPFSTLGENVSGVGGENFRLDYWRGVAVPREAAWRDRTGTIAACARASPPVTEETTHGRHS